MKRILFSLMTIVAVLCVAGAGSFAYFSDIETSTGNTFQAGTLNCQVGDDDPTTVRIDSSTWAPQGLKPGDSGQLDWALKNTGSLGGFLDITFFNLVDEENVVWEPEEELGDTDASGELAENLDLLIYIDEDNDDHYTGTDTLVFQGKAVNIVGEQLSDYPMAEGYDKSIRIEWSIDSGVGNIIQSDIAGFDIDFELQQRAED